MLHRAKAGLTACAVIALAGWSDVSPRPQLPSMRSSGGRSRGGIELIAIPPGDFGMGSPPDEPMRERASTV
jgi:hypothetical protein